MTEDKCRQNLDEHKKKLLSANKKIKVLRTKLNQKIKQITNLKLLVTDLKSNNFIYDNTAEVLNLTFTGTLQDLFKRTGNNNSTQITSTSKYSHELRTFALTLNFLSSKAYEYVRSVFCKALPHQTTLRNWYTYINGEPGFNSEGLKAIQHRVQEQENLLIALSFDEMSIRKHIDFDGYKNRGFIDFGTGLDDENLPAAGNVLVYMAVAVNANWKVPVAYFFVNSLTTAEKANITALVIEKLTAKIISITCDGPTTNISMAKHFGLNLEDGQFNTLLTISNQHIYFIMDNCHMIKLMRNALFQQEVFYDYNAQEINVKYIKLLYELPTYRTVTSQAMKVKLAVQTLSASIADAIDFCRETLKLPQFAHSEATTHFIRFCDRLFDVCNSRNPLGRNFKAPLKANNMHVWKPFLEEAFFYFKSIKLKDGKLAVESRRKTPFVGFLIMIKSFINMSTEYVECETPKLKYILTYNMSQDHLELFFSSIRSKGGFNNNPTARQFVAAYKRLLVHHELVHTKSNCLAIDSTSVLNVTSSLSKKTVDIVTHEEIYISMLGAVNRKRHKNNTRLSILPTVGWLFFEKVTSEISRANPSCFRSNQL